MSTRAILTDVEGTTSAIAFVKDTLFPYARQHLPDFVARNGDRADVRALLDETRRLAGVDGEGDQAVVDQLLRWIDEDQKITPLKALQGMIWQDGYANGELRGHMYDDAAAGLRRWHDAGLALYVYSSGSVAAQKMLFANTDFGDLTPLFAGHFDTTIGSKLEPESYSRIAETIGLAPFEILFLSDNVLELDAARDAGMQAVCLNRGDMHLRPGHGHPVYDTFDQIEP